MSTNNLPTIQQFESILRNILSSDNDTRNQAEKNFQASKQYPEYCIESLIKIIKFSTDISVKSLACILLRKCIVVTKESLYAKLNDTTKQQLKKELLGIMFNEKNEQISKKLGYAICGLASGLILPESNDFPELVPTLLKWSTKEAPLNLKISALRMFANLSTHLQESGFGDDLVKNLFTILSESLKDKNPSLRYEGFLALTAIIMVLTKKNVKEFSKLIPLQLQCIGACLNEKDYKNASDLLQSLIEIGMIKPKYFKEGLRAVMSALFKICKSTNVPLNVKHLAIENMNTLIEGIPSIIRDSLPDLIDNMFPLCLNLMLNIKHEKSWETEETNEDLVENELTNYDVGLESLDRLSIALGGSLIQPVAFKYVPIFLNNKEDWRYRHAGIMCISQTAEGCVEQYQKHLEKLIDFCLILTKDEHPRVRYAAIHCLAQLSTDFVHTLQDKYHSKVVPSLILGMQDSTPKVQAHSATAMINFLDETDVKNITPYLDNTMNCLLGLLHKSKRFVQVQSLSAISAVAECTKGLFVKYYDSVMKYLKVILKEATGNENRLLRARAIECVSLIGVSVGVDVFKKDAKYILDLFSHLQQQPMKSDDPCVNALLQGWSRLAKILGESFIPYLDFVMKPLLAQASLKPQVVVTDADEGQESKEDGMESVTILIKGLGEKRISIKTSILEEKSLACNMLLSYVGTLKDGFYKYAATVTQLMVPLLKFAYLDEIRETAGSIMPELLECVKLSVEKGKVSNDEQPVKKMFDFIFDTHIDAIKIETELKTALILTQGLHDSIKLCGTNCLTSQQLEKVSVVLGQTILNSIMKKKECNEVLKKVDNEEEETLEVEYLEEEIHELRETVQMHDDFIAVLTEVVGVLLKTHDYLPFLGKHLWTIYHQMLNPDLSDQDNRIALCLICDIIENTKNHPTQIFNEKIFNTIMTYAKHDNPDVRQAGVYALGAGAQFFSPTLFGKISKSAIMILINAINGKDAGEERMMAAKCNAVSGLFKVLKYQANNIDVDQLLNIWFNALPVGGDIVEARIVHNHLVKLIQANNKIILGDRNSNLPKILSIFSNILFSDLIDEATQKEVFVLLKKIKDALTQNVFNQTIQQLPEKQRNVIVKALSS